MHTYLHCVSPVPVATGRSRSIWSAPCRRIEASYSSDTRYSVRGR